MYIPDELKLNKFRDVKIPSNRDYFTRFGERTASGYTGDDSAPLAQRKNDELSQEDIDEYNRIREQESRND